MATKTQLETAEILGRAFGIIAVGVIFGLLIATFVTYIISFFADYPVTWGNVFLTWGCIIAFRLVTGTRSAYAKKYFK